MDWSEVGIVLSVRKHGEGAAIITLLTAEHGRHAGLVRGGAGRRARGVHQPGNLVHATWRARLEEHLGTYTCELIEARAAALLNDPLALAGLSAACAVTETALPERDPHPEVFKRLDALIAAMTSGRAWLADYVRWELELLSDIGFGLDLTACAATGETGALIYVSPKTGRAVSAAAGDPYRAKLLRLPDFLLVDDTGENGNAPETTHETLGDTLSGADIRDGLRMTGHFLSRHVFSTRSKGQPPQARTRFVDRIDQLATISSS